MLRYLLVAYPGLTYLFRLDVDIFLYENNFHITPNMHNGRCET